MIYALCIAELIVIYSRDHTSVLPRRESGFTLHVNLGYSGWFVNSALSSSSVFAFNFWHSRKSLTCCWPLREGEGKGVAGRPVILSLDLCGLDCVLCSSNIILKMNLLHTQLCELWGKIFIAVHVFVSVQSFHRGGSNSREMQVPEHQFWDKPTLSIWTHTWSAPKLVSIWHILVWKIVSTDQREWSAAAIWYVVIGWCLADSHGVTVATTSRFDLVIESLLRSLRVVSGFTFKHGA
jgi:hypothetical protein